MLPSLSNMLFVGAGGFVGANARYILSAWFAVQVETRLGWESLPYGTIMVNILGSFLLAIFGVWFVEQTRWSDDVRLLVATGFFGAFTTFSTYANESIQLIREGLWLNGIGTILLTNGLCLIGVVAGLWLAERVW